MGHVINEANFPRRGSMQYWPRKRAKRGYPRINTIPDLSDALLSSFSGYKVGMMQVKLIDNLKHSPSKGQEIIVPVTLIECPPISVFSLRFYQKKSNGSCVVAQINSENYDRELNRKLVLKGKKEKKEKKKVPTKEELLQLAGEGKIYQVSLVIHTNPKMTSLGKKKPEVMEIMISGDTNSAINKAFELLGQQVKVEDVFKPGEQIDIFAVTKGKGFQGSVKRFGVKLGRHKAEKVKRKAMTLGPWSPCKVDHRVPQHGQMGYQTRCDYNKWLLKIVEPKKVENKAGFVRYGNPKNSVLLLKGSVPGPKKRLIRLRKSIRPRNNLPNQAPELINL